MTVLSMTLIKLLTRKSTERELVVSKFSENIKYQKQFKKKLFAYNMAISSMSLQVLAAEAAGSRNSEMYANVYHGIVREKEWWLDEHRMIVSAAEVKTVETEWRGIEQVSNQITQK